ncbi:MAG: cardiolipin synthase [Lachnospiraceae bacterium]|nr:cardiolipin synthase [Lachnospiraceae bacterium]
MKNASLAERTKKKSKKIVSRVFFSRGVPIVLFIILQVVFLVAFAFYFQLYFERYYLVSAFMALFTVIYIINRNSKNEFKLAWIIMIVFLPVFGILMYIYTVINPFTRRLKKRYEKHHGIAMSMLSSCVNEDIIKGEKKEFSLISNFMWETGSYPTYSGSEITYYDEGDKVFEAIIAELKKAEKYIFLQFFIISPGILWDRIHEILKEKAKEGVEVRIIYDGTNTLTNVTKRFRETLEAENLKTRVFLPVRPLFSTNMDFRNHRKIVIVDGKAAFTGGCNIGDEYANIIERFGHWKDCGALIKGTAVNTFVAMFLESWALCVKKAGTEDYRRFSFESSEEFPAAEGSYLIPYGDDPFNHFDIAEELYNHIIRRAQKYIYIMTPYFVIDNEMLNSLCFAARSGVDVRIVLPHIPDKKLPYCVAHTFFERLLRAGVKIYKYTPGFIHSKVVLSDNKKAVVGTVNFDFRSLYHHFEDGLFIYKDPVIKDIKRDFKAVFESSEIISYEAYARMPLWYKISGGLFKVLESLI